MKQLNCLRCNWEMQFIKTEKFQLGQTGWILGDLPNLWAGAMELDIYACHNCGKMEFFKGSYSSEQGRIAQKTCPNCGHAHDMDDPKCPFCKYNYYG